MSKEVPADLRARIRIRRPRLLPLVLVLSLVGLLGTNLATLLSASAYDFLYAGVRKALLLVSTTVAERVTRHSKAAELEAKYAQLEAKDTEIRAKDAEIKAKSTEIETVKKEKAILQDLKAKAENEAANARSKLDEERNKASRWAKELDETKSARAMDAKTAKEVAERVQGRLAKGVARNVAAIPAESIPFIGIAVTVSMTALDLYDACETMKEINQLLLRLGQGTEQPDFCGTTVPTREEVMRGLRTQWRRSLEYAATHARQVKTGLPDPEMRLPSASEALDAVCPLIKISGC